MVAGNQLFVPRASFVSAVKVFGKKRARLGPVLLSFDDGFLIFEAGEITKAMRAEGDWKGRATFSPEILRALATVPPMQDPIPISYADGRLLVGGMTVPCEWESVSKSTVKDLLNPGLVDMLALARTLPRHEILGTPLGKKVRSAVEKSERRIKNAAAQLIDLEISETDIRDLVEARVTMRLVTDGRT